ncbi:hypothetical protein [Kitasatospora sp. MBT66]|uniref:hypothetical protein n=1 Tax=Kitasatospora sp. MBT66 TaxID=1444769 RepID=UPI0005BD6707|nr:hypothetical protein [Kitasatospora sp. MBT66]
MTTHPPEPIVIDLAAEGEFLGPDDPGPDIPTDAGTGSRTADQAGPGPAARLTRAIGTAALAQGRREYTAFREGLTVIKAETGAWASASRETPAHLRAALLNRRYSTWQNKNASQIETLEEKAEELEKQARKALSAGQGEDATPADHKQAGAAAEALREEAAAWRQRVREIHQQPYTGHIDPSDAELESHRRRTANRRRVGLATLVLAAGGLELAIGNMVLPSLTAAALALTAWAKGRFPGWRRELPDVPALAYEPDTDKEKKEKKGKDKEQKDQAQQQQQQAAAGPADQDVLLFPGDTGGPFPIHTVTDPAIAAACVGRALLAQNIDLAGITDTVRTSVGWSMTVTVASGDPADIDSDRNAAAIRTLLKVPRGGLSVECWSDASDTATIRVQTRPGFTDMGPIPDNPALANSILDKGSFGQGLDGTELAFSLAGVMGFLVADSGGGKSSIMLDLADWATSCRDAVVLSVDPRGEGVEALGDAIQLAVSDDKHVLKTLDWLNRLCEGRTRLRKANRWGKVWPITPEHPAVIVFVDEWHDLPAKAKAKLLRLLRIGRKEAVWFIGASQFGTVQDIGSAIAPKMSLKMAGCCRGTDVTGLFGKGALREGYRADRLKPATNTDPADAGTVYIQGLPGQPNRPMKWKFRHLTDSDATRRGDQRAQAGLPDLTASAAAVGLDWPALLTSLGASRPNPAPTTPGTSPTGAPQPSILDVLDAMNEERTIHIGPLLERLAQARPDVYDGFTAEDLEDLLAPYGIESRQARAMTESEGIKNRTGYYLDDIQNALNTDDEDDEDDLDEDDEA